MAKPKTNLAFHWGEKTHIPVTCHLLLARKVQIQGQDVSRPHQHDFWQIEINLPEGTIVTNGKRSLEIKKNDLLIIPPRIWHRFILPDKKTLATTLRFTLKGFPPPDRAIIPAQCIWLDKMLQLLLMMLKDRPQLDVNERTAVEGLISSIVSYCVLPRNPEDQLQGPRLVREILAEVKNADGGRITINQIAQKLNRSVNQISTVFSQSTGTTLKHYIDQQRLNKAKRLLMYTNVSISTAADELDFPDVYAFSRFFSNLAEESPSDFRKRALNKPDP